MKFNLQSAALRLVALALAALLVVLILNGIQAITRVDLLPSVGSAGSPAGSPTERSSGRDTPASRTSGSTPDRPPERAPDRAPDISDFITTLPALPDLPGLPDSQTSWRKIPFPSAASLRQQPVSSAASSMSVPQQEVTSAHPSNFGERFTKDVNGRPVYNDPIVVLHETVWSANSAINTFKVPHENEDDQVSYHSLIRRNGTVIYVVSPEKRAFGAGNSAYQGENGLETVKTHRRYPSSVNNFAYHISLESPPDGANGNQTHSGYTDPQYESLAWLVSQTGVPDERIATHRNVDRSGSRIDPRSFDPRKFLNLLHQYPRSELARAR